MGANFFSRGGEEWLKKINASLNGSRGVDTFSSFREGVEGRRRGGYKIIFFRRKLGFFAREKNASFLYKIGVSSSLLKHREQEDFFLKKIVISSFFWTECFFEGP